MIIKHKVHTKISSDKLEIQNHADKKHKENPDKAENDLVLFGPDATN
jgi:hypothetical protein